MSVELECRQCKHIGSDFKLEETEMHDKASCGNCGAWIKNLSKKDKYGTKEQQADIWEKTKGCCGFCGIRPNPYLKNQLTYDHLEPQALSGGHQTENLMIACKSCNSSKGKKTLEDFRLYLMNKANVDYYFFWFELIKMKPTPPKHISELLNDLKTNISQNLNNDKQENGK